MACRTPPSLSLRSPDLIFSVGCRTDGRRRLVRQSAEYGERREIRSGPYGCRCPTPTGPTGPSGPTGPDHPYSHRSPAEKVRTRRTEGRPVRMPDLLLPASPRSSPDLRRSRAPDLLLLLRSVLLPCRTDGEGLRR